VCKRNSDSCDKNINLEIDDSSKNKTVKIENPKVGEGCQYRLQTNCGYPRMFITLEGGLNYDDIDIAYGIGEWNETDGFNATLLKNEWFNQRNSNSKVLDKEFVGNWIEFSNGIDPNWNFCNSTSRSLYITITRTKKTPIPKLSTSELAETPRALQSTDEKMTITFNVHQGNKRNSAVRILSSIVVLVCTALMAIAF